MALSFAPKTMRPWDVWPYNGQLTDTDQIETIWNNHQNQLVMLLRSADPCEPFETECICIP